MNGGEEATCRRLFASTEHSLSLRRSGGRESAGLVPTAAPRTCCCRAAPASVAAAAAGKPAASGSARSGSSRVARVSVSARGPLAALPRDCALLRLLLRLPGDWGGVAPSRSAPGSGPGVRARVRWPPPDRVPSLGPRSFVPPPASLPTAAYPNPTTCAPEKPNSSRLVLPRGRGAGAGLRRRGGSHHLLPPPRLLPLPCLTLPSREGCLEGSGRPKPEPCSASYDQLSVCLLLPRAQVGEQASVQNMSEGGDGQGRGVGEDHYQRGRHAT